MRSLISLLIRVGIRNLVLDDPAVVDALQGWQPVVAVAARALLLALSSARASPLLPPLRPAPLQLQLCKAVKPGGRLLSWRCCCWCAAALLQICSPRSTRRALHRREVPPAAPGVTALYPHTSTAAQRARPCAQPPAPPTLQLLRQLASLAACLGLLKLCRPADRSCAASGQEGEHLGAQFIARSLPPKGMALQPSSAGAGVLRLLRSAHQTPPMRRSAFTSSSNSTRTIWPVTRLSPASCAQRRCVHLVGNRHSGRAVGKARAGS